MKTIFIRIMSRILPNNLLIRFVNRENFSEEQITIIGKELGRRFEDDAAFEERCEKLFGTTD